MRVWEVVKVEILFFKKSEIKKWIELRNGVFIFYFYFFVFDFLLLVFGMKKESSYYGTLFDYFLIIHSILFLLGFEDILQSENILQPLSVILLVSQSHHRAMLRVI